MIDQPEKVQSAEAVVRPSRSSNLLHVIACLACAVTLFTAPAPQPQTHASAPQVGNRGAKKDDAEIWTDVQQWMQKNCINQWTFYDRKLSDRPGQQQHAKKLMIEQYQRVMSAKDPQMQQALTLQAKYRDNIFGIVLDFKHGQKTRAVALNQIKQWEDKLADIEITTRRARISELQNEIADLQQRRADYVARVSARDLNQADLPPARINASTSGEAAVMEEIPAPPFKSGPTTRPDNH